MKNSLNKKTVVRIAENISSAYAEFELERFVKLASTGLGGLELKQRVEHIIQALLATMPNEFQRCVAILEQLPELWQRGEDTDSFQVFAAWPVIDFVAVKGIDEPETAMPLLANLTSMFSAEFALRAFIDRYPEDAMVFLLACAQSNNEHIRRMSSEACRPRLPWGLQLKKLVENPASIFPILDTLLFDDSLYVRRSVANNLNDIAKDHPGKVIEWCEVALELICEDPQQVKDRQWLVNHACRSLVKSGLPEVFPLLGYKADVSKMKASLAIVNHDISMGEDLEFELALEVNRDKQKFVVDFVIYHQKANGKLTPKVFKLKNVDCKKSAVLNFQKKHRFKVITTRRYYAGLHQLGILVNGIELAREDFYLSL